MEEIVSNATKTKGAEKIHQVSWCEDSGDVHRVLRAGARLSFQKLGYHNTRGPHNYSV